MTVDGVSMAKLRELAEEMCAVDLSSEEVLWLLDRIEEAREIIAEPEGAPGRHRDDEVVCTFCRRIFEPPEHEHDEDCWVVRARAWLAFVEETP